MPEVVIGFVPDVGGTWLLSHAPGELGTHVAITGGTFSGADAIALGLADHYVPSGDLPTFMVALETTPVADALSRFATTPPPSELAAQRHWIDDCYASDSAADIVRALGASPSEQARATASVLASRSPTAVSVTLASLRRARTMATLEEALDQEYRVSVRFTEGTEFREGVRAQVIDKDRMPRWSPDSLAGVDPAEVERYFDSLGTRELGLATAPHTRGGSATT
jgi:enoyl-CoA hydratase